MEHTACQCRRNLEYDDWSDKSSLTTGIRMEESPQTLPDLCPEFDALGSGITDWLTSGTNLWTFPEKDEIGNVVDMEGRMRQREDRVLRYKEKRHNRLFAKRIRYEVRKLNTEKQPRVKGRFVGRNVDD